MQVLSIVGQKGGTGKTTLAQCLAVAAANDGLSVLILDMDPQATAANWYDRREEKEKPMVTTAPPGRLRQAVDAAAASGVDLVIIDTPGKLEGPAITAVGLAGLVLIPMHAQIKDLETLSATKDLLHSAGDPPALVILSAVPVAGKRHEEAAEYVKALGLSICPAWLSQRVAYGDADTAGLAAQEYDPDGKAAEEIKRVHKFICALLSESKAHDKERAGTHIGATAG